MKEKEYMFEKNDVIVSATDPKGRIIYANTSFCEACGYTREEIAGKPHNIIRHPDIPKTIFALLWERVLAGKSIYAFVKNRTKSGGYYWVKAYVAPLSRGEKIEKIISYRKPISTTVTDVIVPFYATLKALEENHSVAAARAHLETFLKERSLTYDQFIDRVSLGQSVQNPALLSLNIAEHKVAHLLFKARTFRKIDNNETNIHVPRSDECAFGQWLFSVRNQPFATTKEFQDICKLHQHIHVKLDTFTQKIHTSHERTALEKELTTMTDTIFITIQHLTDTTKE